MKTLPLLTLGAVLLTATPALAQTELKPTLTQAGARRAIAGALAAAAEKGAPGGAVAVVDAGGRPLAVDRLDGTFAAAADISIGKARTAALFGRPTRVLEQAINGGRDAMLGLAGAGIGATPLLGGIPIVVDGVVVGAVGVSGAASADQDEELAIAGAQAVMSAGADGVKAVHHVPAAEVDAAFPVDTTIHRGGNFRIAPSHRDGPGLAEVHRDDTDVFYVVEGSATLVLGGKVIDPKEEKRGEVRGSGIDGGEVHPIAKGDVLVIPAGVPHWFREVKAPFRYYTVKVGGAL